MVLSLLAMTIQAPCHFDPKCLIRMLSKSQVRPFHTLILTNPMQRNRIWCKCMFWRLIDVETSPFVWIPFILRNDQTDQFCRLYLLNKIAEVFTRCSNQYPNKNLSAACSLRSSSILNIPDFYGSINIMIVNIESRVEGGFERWTLIL